MQRYEASPAYTDRVAGALKFVDPNETPADEWDHETIQQLANYLAAWDYSPHDLASRELNLYAMYDLLKWTRANS